MSWQQPRMWATIGNALGVCAFVSLRDAGGLPRRSGEQAHRCAVLNKGRSPEGRWALECSRILFAQQCAGTAAAGSVPFLLVMKDPQVLAD